MYTEVHKAKWDLIVAMIVLLIADTLVIAARVYVRARMISNFGWDDRLLCLSFVSTHLCSASTYANVNRDLDRD